MTPLPVSFTVSVSENTGSAADIWETDLTTYIYLCGDSGSKMFQIIVLKYDIGGISFRNDVIYSLERAVD